MPVSGCAGGRGDGDLRIFGTRPLTGDNSREIGDFSLYPLGGSAMSMWG